MTTNASGTARAGDTRLSVRELNATSRIENAAVAMTITGSDVTSRALRYKASRVALPAMNCALTAPAHVIAVKTAAPGSGRDWAITE